MTESLLIPPATDTRDDHFLDRFDGVHVTQTVTFGHPLAMRFFRRTFSATARNYYFIAVIAPTAARKSARQLAAAHALIAQSVDQSIQETEHDLHELRAPFDQALLSASSTCDKCDPIAVKLITPMSGKHLALLRQSDDLLLLLERLWIQSGVSNDQRDRFQGRVKRRLNRVALIARETCVKLTRGDLLR